MRPGLWWMRRLHLPAKLATLAVLIACTLAAALLGAPGSPCGCGRATCLRESLQL